MAMNNNPKKCRGEKRGNSAFQMASRKRVNV